MALSLTYNFVRYSYRVKTHNCLTIQFPFNKPTDGHKECGILRMRNADPMKVIAPTNQCYLYPCHWDIPGPKISQSQPLEEQIESWLSSKLEVQEEGSEHCRFFFEISPQDMGDSINGGTPKCLVYNGKSS